MIMNVKNHTASAALKILAHGGEDMRVNICVNGQALTLSAEFDHAVFDVLMQHPPIAAKVREMVRQITLGEGAMTDAQALSEIEEAKRILDKHYDSGFLIGVWHEQYDGISYRYADGRYAELAKRELAEV